MFWPFSHSKMPEHQDGLIEERAREKSNASIGNTNSGN